MIEATAIIYNNNNESDCHVSISGNAEAVAVEYASITRALIKSEGGQAILDRAMDIMKKEIDEHEEKRSK